MLYSTLHLAFDLPSVLVANGTANRDHFLFSVCAANSLVLSNAKYLLPKNVPKRELKLITRACDVASVVYALGYQIAYKSYSLESVVSALLFAYVSCRNFFFRPQKKCTASPTESLLHRYFYSLTRFCFCFSFLQYLRSA